MTSWIRSLVLQGRKSPRDNGDLSNLMKNSFERHLKRLPPRALAILGIGYR